MWLYRCSGPSTNNNGSPLFQYDFTKLSSLKLKVTKQYHDYGVYNSHSKLFKHMFFYSKTIILEDQTPSNPDVSWFSIVQPLIFQGSFTTPPATPAFLRASPRWLSAPRHRARSASRWDVGRSPAAGWTNASANTGLSGCIPSGND